FDQHEPKAVIEAVGDAMPEDRHRDPDEEVFDDHRQADPGAAAHRAADHAAVFRPGGGNVLATLCALVLGDLIGEIAQGLRHEFENTVLAVLVPDEHPEDAD